MKKTILYAVKLAVIATLVCIGCAVDPESKSSEVSEFLERFIALPEYTLEIGKNQIEAGTVMRNPDKEIYTAGEQVTVTATPASTDYRFSGWTGAVVSANNPLIITMDGNKALTANFQPNGTTPDTGYTLIVGINRINAGTVTRNPKKDAYTAGEQVTVIATAAAGYAFTGWSGASTSENDTIVFNMDNNKTLTANFEAIYTVTYNGNGNTGGTAPVDANSPYLNRSTVTVLGRNNLERTGYTFNGWNTAADGNGTNHASGAIFSITQNTILYAKWKIDDDDTVTHIPEPSLKAEPVAASNNPSDPKILNSWRDGEKNYFVIDVGVIRKNFISAIFGPEHYDGYHPVSVTIKDINTSTVTTSTTETVSKSIAISNTSGVKMGLEEAIKTGFPGIGDLTVKLNLEVSETVKVDNGKTTTTSVNNIVTYVQSQETSRTMTFGSNGAPAGYYRYALYGVSDVYFVIETSSDNQTLLSWDVISCVRSGDYLRHNDYSSNGKFDNSPESGNEIVFAEDFYKTLPIPQNTVIKVERRVLTEEFTTAGTHNYTFDKGFPATIEVYVIGAGGGGQGGHTRSQPTIKPPFTDYLRGTGGAGGGGAAAYMKLSIEQPATFNISVGKGGSGGAGKHVTLAQWESGTPGSNGDSSSVTTGSITLTAEGGRRGGGNGNRDLFGGSGGVKSVSSTGLLEFYSDAGKNGGEGVAEGDPGIRGGNAGTIPDDYGSGAPYGGGLGAARGSAAGTGGGGFGGYNSDQSGGSGGNGAVKIVVTYDEVL